MGGKHVIAGDGKRNLVLVVGVRNSAGSSSRDPAGTEGLN
jgi:hypothetical protein